MLAFGSASPQREVLVAVRLGLWPNLFTRILITDKGEALEDRLISYEAAKGKIM